MIKEFTERMSNPGGKKILGVKTDTQTITEKRVPIYPYYKETFKVMEMIEQERERRLYYPSFEERLKMLRGHKSKVRTEEDLDEFEKEEKRLKRHISLQHSPMRITIPEDKYEIILENYKKESAEIREKTKSLQDERDEAEAEIKRLIQVKEELTEEIKTNINLMHKAEVLKEVLDEHGRSFDIGVTQEEVYNNKTESDYTWKERGLGQSAGNIKTYKTVKDEGDK